MCEASVPVDAATAMVLLCTLDRRGQWPVAEAAFLAAFGRLDAFASLVPPPPPERAVSSDAAALLHRLRAVRTAAQGAPACRLFRYKPPPVRSVCVLPVCVCANAETPQSPVCAR